MPRPPEISTFTWGDVTCRVEHVRDFRIDGWSRLILRVVHPPGAPLPLTENGDFVHDLDEDHVVLAGGAVAFLMAWMNREAGSLRYAQALYKWKQGDLFR